MSRHALATGYRQPHTMPDSYGEKIIDWSTGASYATANSATIDGANNTDGSSVTLSIPYDAATGYCDADLTAPVAFSRLHSIGFWAYLPEGQDYAIMRLYLSASLGFTNYYQVDCLICKPGWHFYTTILNQEGGSLQHPRVVGTITWATDTLQRIRFRDLDNEANTGYARSTTGDAFRIGNVYINCRSRPKFMIHTDDGLHNNYLTEFAGKTVFSILAERGIRATAHVPTNRIGDANRETWASLAFLASKGWDIALHGWDEEFTYATNFSTAEQVRDELNLGIVDLLAQGYSNTAGVFALPQGGHARFVWDGIHLTNINHVRGTAKVHSAYPFGLNVGSEDQISNTNTAFDGSILTMPGGMQWDNPTSYSLQDNIDYVDWCIKTGTTGLAYGHALDASIIAVLEGLADHLVQRQNEGLIDIVTMSEWVSGLGADA